MHTIVRSIDRLTEIIGKCASFIIVPLVAGIVYDVFMRYVFNKPTFWVYDSTYMMYGVYIMLGSAYTHLADGHVRMDLFTGKLNERKKAIIECVCYLLFFFPLFIVLVKYCSQHAIWSFSARESSSASTWRPPVYPFKTNHCVWIPFVSASRIFAICKGFVRGHSRTSVQGLMLYPCYPDAFIPIEKGKD